MDRVDRAGRFVDATPERVFGAFVDPDAVVEWLPPDDMTGHIDHFDLRPGGTYRLTLRYGRNDEEAGKAADGSDLVEGRFVRIVESEAVDQEIEFPSDDPTFARTMRMRWSVTAHGDGSLVETTATDAPSGIRQPDHEAALTSTLTNLASYLAATDTAS